MTNEQKSKQAFDLQTGFGPMMGNEDLMKILGFKTMFAFRAAIKEILSELIHLILKGEEESLPIQEMLKIGFHHSIMQQLTIKQTR